MLSLQDKLNHKPKCRVDLHVHLEGSIRHETIWEVMRKKGHELPGDGSLRALKDAVIVHEPKDLSAYIQQFSIFMPAFVDDLEAIERISFEFAEDLHQNSVAYCELRVVPCDFISDDMATVPRDEENDVPNSTSHPEEGAIKPEDVIDAILKGLSAAEEKYDTKVKLILFCYYPRRMNLWETLRLCELYKDKGVIGIDFAGFEKIFSENGVESPEGEELHKVFSAAQEKGIHRTIHAGEAGPGKAVEQALSLLGAERIGHGYRVIECEEVYQKCLKDGVHFEMCPHCSYLTGAIKDIQLESKRHPILRLAEDGASFSIGTDGPTLTNSRLNEEYNMLRSWGFTEAHIARCNFEGALHCFLPPEEKVELITLLKRSYGVVDYAVPSSSASPSSTPSTPSTLEKAKKVSSRKPEIQISTWEDRS